MTETQRFRFDATAFTDPSLHFTFTEGTGATYVSDAVNWQSNSFEVFGHDSLATRLAQITNTHQGCSSVMVMRAF